jgi:surface antigen
MGSRQGGGRGFSIRVALLGTVFASALLLAPAVAAARANHPAHQQTQQRHVAAKHAPARHVAAKAHSTKSRLVSGHKLKRHVAPVSKAQLRKGGRHVASGQLIHGKHSKARYTTAAYRGGISCVPFARAASGIELKGNATNWWDAAAGIYARGARPEQGSVLNFRSTGRMRLGHVAVVAKVINSREVEIDHANWAGPGARKGGVSRGIPVIDVSARNDWSEVRVGLGRSGEFGSVYPTYGFIYDRPDRGVMVANTLAPSHGGIVTASARHAAVEVADAPRHGRGSRNVIDAPTRSLR